MIDDTNEIPLGDSKEFIIQGIGDKEIMRDRITIEPRGSSYSNVMKEHPTQYNCIG